MMFEENEIAEKAIQNRWVNAIEYHPSGELLASVHNDNSVQIWDLVQEQVIRMLELRDPSLKFSPDGNIMAGPLREDGGNIVRLWTVGEAENLGDIAVSGEIRDIGFSPDRSMLVISTFARPTAPNAESVTVIYDVSTKQPLYTLDQNIEDGNYPVLGMFTPDGGHLSVALNNGTLELWRLPGAEPIEAPPINLREPPSIPGDVLFDTDSAELKESADEVLKEVAADLYDALPKAEITFVGHTDSRGSADYNLQLSKDRSSAVKAWFEEWAKANEVETWVLLVEGRGANDLKVPDTDIEGTFLESAGALNRRVEMEVKISE